MRKTKNELGRNAKVVKTLAISQILIMFLEIFAVSVLFSLSLGGVSAEIIKKDSMGNLYKEITTSSGTKLQMQYSTGGNWNDYLSADSFKALEAKGTILTDSSATQAATTPTVTQTTAAATQPPAKAITSRPAQVPQGNSVVNSQTVTGTWFSSGLADTTQKMNAAQEYLSSYQDLQKYVSGATKTRPNGWAEVQEGDDYFYKKTLTDGTILKTSSRTLVSDSINKEITQQTNQITKLTNQQTQLINDFNAANSNNYFATADSNGLVTFTKKDGTPFAYGPDLYTYELDAKEFAEYSKTLDATQAAGFTANDAGIIDFNRQTELTNIGKARTYTPAEIAELNTLNKKAEDGKAAQATAAAAGGTSGAEKFRTPFGEFTFETFGNWAPLAGNLVQGAYWSTVVLGLTAGLASFLPDKLKDAVQPFGQAAALGIMTYSTVKGSLGTAFNYWKPDPNSASYGGKTWNWISKHQAGISVGAGLIVAYIYFAKNYEKTQTQSQTIEFKCMAWQAPLGGESCEKCNANVLQPCSEYRCRSLGQACKLINQGTGFEKCIDGSRNDVTSPGIKPNKDTLTSGYKYAAVTNRPPGGNGPAGMTIQNSDGGCLAAFTPFEFGVITTDTGDVTQEAQCKIDFNHTKSFNEMQYWMGDDNLFTENHTQIISLPGSITDKNTSLPSIQNNNEYTFYIRCRDGNGNENRDEFAVRFCIDDGPDLTAPVIVATSIPSNSPVLYKADNVSMELYTNEPASCKWARADKDYSNMENSMSCDTSTIEMNAELLYTCKTTLTEIKDKQANDFYFRCNDSAGMAMQEGYKYTLMGTQPLSILSTGPTDIIGGSTSTVSTILTVQTDNGYKNGEARCLYSTTNSSYIEMFQTGGNQHTQTLDLLNGTYNYYFKCVDAGGNTAYNSTNFSVFVDKYTPIVVRAYSLENYLVIVTNENSSCSYSTSSCNFDLSKSEGTPMPYTNSIVHSASWKTNQNYYIKCNDNYDNQPNPEECSIVLRPYEISQI